MDCSRPGSSVLHYLLELAQFHIQWVADTISPSHPLPHPSSPFAINLYEHQVSSNESALPIRWPVLEFQLQHQSSNEYLGLLSFRMDWFDLTAVQGTLKSLLQHHSLKSSILRCLAIFMVQLSHPYMATGETHKIQRLPVQEVEILPQEWTTGSSSAANPWHLPYFWA